MKRSTAVLMFIFAVIFAVSCANDGKDGAQGPTGYVMVAFQDGISPSNAYNSTADNFAIAGAINDNYGLLEYFVGGENVTALVKWDISSLVPSDVTIEKAYVTLYCFTSTGTTIFSVHNVENQWDETQMTWVNRTAGEMWTTPGGDYGASLNTFTVDVSGLYYTVELPAATAQSWLTNPALNYGIAIKKSSGAAGTSAILTSQNSTIALNRPKLTLYYTLP